MNFDTSTFLPLNIFIINYLNELWVKFHFDISIFLPLFIFTLGYLKDLWTKRREVKRTRKALVKFLLELFIELEKNMNAYPQHLQNVSEVIELNYSKSTLITIESHSLGLINRLSKIDSKELHIAIMQEFKNNSDLYNQIYFEIDFYDDFYKRLLETIKSYQKSSNELKHEFRNGLYDFYSYNGNLISILNSKSINQEYVKFSIDITSKSLSAQTDELIYYYKEFLKPIAEYVKENIRTESFASELIQRVNRLKVILEDLNGNSEMYGQAFKRNSIELETSLKQINKIIMVLKEKK